MTLVGVVGMVSMAIEKISIGESIFGIATEFFGSSNDVYSCDPGIF